MRTTQARAHWTTLPIEIQLVIFSFLSITHLIQNVRLVCKDWNQLICVSDLTSTLNTVQSKFLWLPFLKKLFKSVPIFNLEEYLSFYISHHQNKIWKFCYISYLLNEKCPGISELSYSTPPLSKDSSGKLIDRVKKKFKKSLVPNHSSSLSTSRIEHRKSSLDFPFKDQIHLNSFVPRIILLGGGDVGKSTVMKQAKILQEEGIPFSPEERCSYRYFCQNTAISQMKQLIQATYQLNVPVDPSVKECSQRVMEIGFRNDSFSCDVGLDLIKLWKDKGIQEAYEKRDIYFQLNCTTKYFFESIQRFCQPNFLPTFEDILQTRVRSTGMEEAYLRFYRGKIYLIDTGGERSERRKWIHYFKSINLVIFCVSLLEYIQSLREDAFQNRLKESLEIFRACATDSSLPRFVLLFTKVDLFIERLKQYPLTLCFPEYTGNNSFSSAYTYIRDQFLALDVHKKVLFSYPVCTINTFNFSLIWTHILEIAFEEH